VIPGTLGILQIQDIRLNLDVRPNRVVHLNLDILQNLGNLECLVFLGYQEFLVIPENLMILEILGIRLNLDNLHYLVFLQSLDTLYTHTRARA
jgi:hypothetical protein